MLAFSRIRQRFIVKFDVDVENPPENVLIVKSVLPQQVNEVETCIVKNMFGFSILLFTAINVDDKSHRQVLTPVKNSQLLLKLEIIDKYRLVTNHKMRHKGNCNIF